MFDALDVAIGVTFFFLLVSVIVTAATEVLELMWKRRGEYLAKGVRILLQGEGKDNALTKAFYEHPLIRPLHGAQNLGEPTNWVVRAWRAVRGWLPGNRATRRTKRGVPEDLPDVLPSYIPPRTFAIALLDLAGQLRSRDAHEAAKDNHEHLNGVLGPLILAAGVAVEAQIESIEAWYTDAMHRVAGWYKRHAQTVALVLGMLVVGMLNADTVTVVRSLATDDDLRAAYVAAAEAYIEEAAAEAGSEETPTAEPTGEEAPATDEAPAATAPADTTASAAPADSSAAAPTAPVDSVSAALEGYREAVRELEGLGLPLGWARTNPSALWPTRLTVAEVDSLEAYCRRTFRAPCAEADNEEEPERRIRAARDALLAARAQPPSGRQNAAWWFWKLFGLLLTGVAVSLGAPFWFDLLDRFMVVRSTLKPPPSDQNGASGQLLGSERNQAFLRKSRGVLPTIGVGADAALLQRTTPTSPQREAPPADVDGPVPKPQETPARSNPPHEEG